MCSFPAAPIASARIWSTQTRMTWGRSGEGGEGFVEGTAGMASSEVSGGVGQGRWRMGPSAAVRLRAGLARTMLGLRAGALGPLLLLLAQLGGGDAGLLALAVLVRLVGGLRLQHRGADLIAHRADGAGVAGQVQHVGAAVAGHVLH